MTISAFADQHRQNDTWQHAPVRRAYRERKRHEAEARQVAFDADVARVMREQNCSETTARDVVRARRRFDHRIEQRAIDLTRTTR
jgi:hypothetical protein